jgi:hypothetical protein
MIEMDLRLGNYINVSEYNNETKNYTYTKMKVTALKIFNQIEARKLVYAAESKLYSSEEVFGIDLNKTLLDKLIHRDDRWMTNGWIFHDFLLSEIEDGYYFTGNNNLIHKIPMYCLHQLQNKIYELSGEDLYIDWDWLVTL